jgi:hypothetical protein
MNNKVSPVCYEIECLDEETGVWNFVSSVPIAATRSEAQRIAMSYLVALDCQGTVGIVEVSDNGSRLGIWQNGAWL